MSRRRMRRRLAVGSCGDKRLITAYGARTFDDPCHKEGAVVDLGICTTEDVRVWDARIDDLSAIALENWNRLIDIENEKQDWTQSRKVRDWYDNVLKRIKDLPRPDWTDEWIMPLGPDIHEMIARMMGVCQDLACLIEELRAGIVAQGGTPGKVPYIEPRKPKGSLLERISNETARQVDDTRQTLVRGLAIAGVVAGGLYILRPVIEKHLGMRKGAA